MKSALPVVLVVAAVVIIGLLMLSKGAPKQAVIEPTPESKMVASPEPSKEESVNTIQVEAGSFYYKPATMTVKKGEKVRIVMKAVSMMHDFNIDELGVKMPIVKNGDTGTVEFTPDKVGVFEYYCSVGQHRSLGQVGKITVQE